MDPRLQRRVQRYGWDKASEHYEAFWREQLEPAQSLMMEMAALQQGEHVLDVACGTGLVTLRAADQVGDGGRVLGTDISENMVAAAKRIACERGVAHAQFERMDAETLDVPDGSFDTALCALGLMYFPEPVKALAEMRRVLKPGGRALASVWGQRDNCGWAEIFPIVDARVKSEVCPMFFQLGSGDAMRFAFEAAEYRDVRVERISTTLYYDSEKDAIGAAFAGGPVALAYSRFDESTKAEAHAEYLASIAPYRIDDRYEIPGEFVVTSGRRP